MKYFNNFNNLNFIGKITIFLLIIAGNYIGDIYSCGLRLLFNEYMLLKHIIGLLIMIFFVGLIVEKIKIHERIFASFILYIIFVLTMRLPMILTLIVIILFAIIYILTIYIEDLKNKKNENTKKEIKDIKYEKNIIFYENILNKLLIITLIIIILGSFGLCILLKINIGNKFSIYNFLLGSRDQECFTKEIYDIFKNNFFKFEFARRKSQMLNKQKKKNKNFIPLKLQKKIKIN